MCKSKRLKSTCFLIIIACTLTSSFCGAGTVVIYSDDFSGIGGLDGKAPDVRPAQETWIAAEVFGADGTVSANTLDGYTYQALLPFSPDAGKTYTLSLDVDPQSSKDPTTWFALGFSNSNVTASSEDDDQFWTVGIAWILHRVTRAREEIDEIQTFLGPGMTEVQSHESKEEGMVTLSVVLDTTAGQWTVEWFRNDQSIRGPVAFATNPEISYVGFTKFWVTAGIVDNFKLELYEDRFASVPSPHDGAKDVPPDVVLTWKPGSYVVGLSPKHKVFFSKNFEHVRDGIGGVEQDVERYPVSGTLSLDLGETYYWRVNEANPTTGWDEGTVWQFTVADYLVVDDFEDYDDVDNQIWYAWREEFGYPYLPTYTDTGSVVYAVTAIIDTEQNIVHGGSQSMLFWYDNNKPDKFKYSEATLTLSYPRDWTECGVKALSLWFRGYPASLGSFTEGPVGTYTMTASGYDIWTNADGVEADEFHYAFKMLTGSGTIIAKVESLENTNGWAKAGVMIRETLDPNSAHAFACVTPSNGVAFQGRSETSGTSFNTNQTGITAPHWVRLERDLSGNFTVSHSSNGSTWESVQNTTPQNIPMSANVYVGLALTAHDPALTCEAVFSNVTITGNISAQWIHKDIGIQSNDPEPMYVAVANNTGTPAVVYHDNPNAAQIDTWTEWNIDLQDFADQGVNLTDVNSIAIGFGDRNNPQAGGSGLMYFDDIRLYRPRYVPDKMTPHEADFTDDGVVDYRDLEIMANDWLDVGDDLSADIDEDNDVDFADYAVIADTWLDKLLWPLP